MLRRAALVGTDVSEEGTASIDKNRRARNTVSKRLATEAGSVLLLLGSGNVPRSPILVTLMMEVKRFFKTSVLTRSTRRYIPEDEILHSHHRENLKSHDIDDDCGVISE
jgi:hypothetical protein